MDDKDILILIEKLRSKTISSEELKSLRYVLYRTKDSKELLKLMHDEFRQSVESSPSLSDYGHSDLVKKRLEKNIGNGNVRIGQSKLFYWAASVAAACAVIGFVFFSQLSKDTKAGIVWETISTKHGERKKVSLGDGTSIVLNGNTSIAYPKHILNNLRLIKLDGEAFFDIAKNAEKPFLIISKDFTTQVVGTSFNIDSDLSKVVEVNTGKVNVFALREDQTIGLISPDNGMQTDIIEKITYLSADKVSLVKGQKAQLDMNNQWAISDYHYKNWLHNELVYLNEPMFVIAKKAYRNFGDSIAVHPDLADKNITITFTDKNKEQVLNTLAELCNGTLTLNHMEDIWEIKK